MTKKKKIRFSLSKLLALCVMLTLLLTSGVFAQADGEFVLPASANWEETQRYFFDDLGYTEDSYYVGYYSTASHLTLQEYEHCGWNYVTLDYNTVDPLYYMVMDPEDVRFPCLASSDYVTQTRTLQNAGAYEFTLLDSYNTSAKQGEYYFMVVMTIAGYFTTDCSGSGIWNV